MLSSAIGDWWNAWVGLTALGLLWLICAATLLLAPPATFVLYKAADVTARGRSFTAKELLGWLKSYFWKSWQWAFLNLCAFFSLWLNLQYYGRLESAWAPSFLVLTGFVGAFWSMVQFYALPYLVAQDEPKLRHAFRNALLTLLASPVYSALLVGVASILLYASIRLPVLLFLGVPSFVAVLGVHAVKERLKTFGKAER